MLKMFIHFEYNATLICKLGDLDIKYSEYIDEDGSLYNQNMEILLTYRKYFEYSQYFNIFSGPADFFHRNSEQFIDC